MQTLKNTSFKRSEVRIELLKYVVCTTLIDTGKTPSNINNSNRTTDGKSVYICKYNSDKENEELRIEYRLERPFFLDFVNVLSLFQKVHFEAAVRTFTLYPLNFLALACFLFFSAPKKATCAGLNRRDVKQCVAFILRMSYVFKEQRKKERHFLNMLFGPCLLLQFSVCE